MPSSHNECVTDHKGRKQTDESLSAERAKTDESLALVRLKTEDHADESVYLNREKLDKARSRSRSAADDLSSAGRADEPGSPEHHLEAEERLRQERLEADEALYQERRHVDSVLESERWRKKLAEQKFFHSERKETDQNLSLERHQTDADSQKAAAALTSRDDFLAIVSHDLRNPLGSISIAADLLMESPIYAMANDEDKQFLELIGRNASEALRLIGDLVDLDRMVSGKLSLEIKKHKLAEIVRNSILSLEPQASLKKLILKSSVEGVEITAKCDRDRISQILSNLIGNAIKFAPNGSVITLNVQSRDDEVLISVADLGPGIPLDMQEKIFERLWQVGKRDRSGLGLGLYISKMIAEAHGGRIWVESEIGKGSIFFLSLPSRGCS